MFKTHEITWPHLFHILYQREEITTVKCWNLNCREFRSLLCGMCLTQVQWDIMRAGIILENGDDAEKAPCPQPPTEYCEQAIVSECENQGPESNIEIKLSLSSSFFFQNVRTQIGAI